MAKKFRTTIEVSNANGEVIGTIVDNMQNKTALESYRPKIISIEKKLAKISIIGEGLLSDPAYISTIYNLAAENKVEIEMVTFSEVSISIVVKEKFAESFASIAHDALIE